MHTLYLDETSTTNNTHFKTASQLIKTTPDELEELKVYKKKSKFLKNFNSKTGKYIYTFDLPAVTSCPDNKSCYKTCYANRGSFTWKQAKKSNEANFAIALLDLPYLETELNKEIRQKRKKPISCIRIHASGDFFSMEYVMLWCRIASDNPNVNFYAYTKTRQIKGLVIPKNFNIIDSFVTDNDGKKHLNYGSFSAMLELSKSIKGLLCPITKGTHLNLPKLQPKNGFTCSTCKYCITKKKPTFVMH